MTLDGNRWKSLAVLLTLSASALSCASSGGDAGGGGTGTATGSGASASGSGGGKATGSGGATASGGSSGSSGSAGMNVTGSAGTSGRAGASGQAGTSGGASTSGKAGTSGSAGASGSCAGALTLCSGSCVDTTGSQNNCGGCGQACRSDETCWQSACICAAGQGDCGGSCQDITSSTINCGACGTLCAIGATCVTGVCQCPTGQTPCSGACTNMNTDGKNCGACGKVCGTGTSCLFGACLDPTSLSCTPSAQANKTSTTTDPITLGKYWINNNEWGASTGSGTQFIWSTCQQGDLIGWGTSWNWTGTTNMVKSYSSSVLGWQYGWKLTNSGLPLQLSAGNQLNCGWSFNFTQSGGSADVSYDMFLHTVPMPGNAAIPGTTDTPTDEIMIWLYTANGAAPVGTKQTTVLIDSASWDLYRGLTTWNVFSYVRTANATSAVVNVMDFMNDLVTRGWVQSSKYLTSVQSGTEIFTGIGELDTTGYYCRVQ